MAASCSVATESFLRHTDSNYTVPTSRNLTSLRSFISLSPLDGLCFVPIKQNSWPQKFSWVVKCQQKKNRWENHPPESGVMKRAQIKALSITLRREAAKANMEKKAGPKKSKKLLPRTVLEALTDRIDNKQWESALKVAETRFASNTIVLRQLVKVKVPPCNMVISTNWTIWKQSSSERAEKIRDRILNEKWWDIVTYLLGITEPIMSMIRYTDMDRPCIGEIYDGIDSMLEKMKCTINEREKDPNEKFFKEVEAIVVERWNKMTTPLHLLAYALTPKYYSNQFLDKLGRIPPWRDLEVSDGYKAAFLRLYPDDDLRDIVTNEFIEFANGNGLSVDALPHRSKKDAHSWWYFHGACFQHLQPLAVKVLSQVFDILREQLWYRPNPRIYTRLLVMLGKCRQYEHAESLFKLMIDEGLEPSIESYTALASAYSRSGLLQKAFSVVHQMKAFPQCQPDVYTYSILIKSSVEVSRFDYVDMLLSEMSANGIKPNTVTYNTILDAYGKAGKFKDMEDVLSEMLENPDSKPDVWTMNATLRAFGNSSQIEMMENCYEKFQGVGVQPDIRTFNILMYAYGKERLYDKMTAVMEYMQKYYFSWTTVTYNVLIDAFGKVGDIAQMEYLFNLMISEGVKPDCVTLCSLVNAYGKACAIRKIVRVMRKLENSDIVPDTAFFNSVMDAYGRFGDLAEMENVLIQMKDKGCKPDRITIATMTKAYLSKGMVDKVQELEQKMLNIDRFGTYRPTTMKSLTNQ